MLKRNKIRAGIATLAAGTIIGVGGFAFASFVQNQAVEATGKAATFAPVEVSGTLVSTDLLPGDTSDVTLALKNPGGNSVRAKATAITANGVEITSGEPGCAGYVVQDPANGANGALPTMNADQELPYTLVQGVTLRTDAPLVCQGISFKTNWSVTFQPVRG